MKSSSTLRNLAQRTIPAKQGLAEPTAGNTGIALAALSNAQGSKVELTVPAATPEG